MAELKNYMRYHPVRGLPELEFLGYRNDPRSTVLDVHAHNAFEIVCLEHGQVCWQENGRPIALRGNEMSLTFPGVPHAGAGKILNPSTFYWMLLALPRPEELQKRTVLNLPPAEARSLARGYHGIRRSVCRVSPAVRDGFKELLKTVTQPGLLQEARARGVLTALAIDVLRCFTSPPPCDPPPAVIDEAMRRLTLDLSAPPRIAELADALRVSPSYLNRRFKAQFGLTPKDFLTHARLARAKELLAGTDDELTGIALKMGFASSQHFSSAFKKIEGQTPTDYRRSARRVSGGINLL